MQAALKIVLEPVFEADFLPCSFGFRPRRGAHDALQVLIDESWRGCGWLVETDIANCFEAIPHIELIKAVEERVCDQSVLTLLRVILRAGVSENGVVRKADRGLPRVGWFLRCSATSICIGSIGPGTCVSTVSWSGTPTMVRHEHNRRFRCRRKLLTWCCTGDGGRPSGTAHAGGGPKPPQVAPVNELG
ncbi:reverse transcriptase domain-containing protein [Streptomyces chiangmaiensis]